MTSKIFTCKCLVDTYRKSKCSEAQARESTLRRGTGGSLQCQSRSHPLPHRTSEKNSTEDSVASHCSALWSGWKFCPEQSFRAPAPSTMNVTTVNAQLPEALQEDSAKGGCTGGFMGGPGNGFYHFTCMFLFFCWLKTTG